MRSLLAAAGNIVTRYLRDEGGTPLRHAKDTQCALTALLSARVMCQILIVEARGWSDLAAL